MSGIGRLSRRLSRKNPGKADGDGNGHLALSLPKEQIVLSDASVAPQPSPKPSHSSLKPAPPTTKPSPPSTKPAPLSTKPSPPSTKPSPTSKKPVIKQKPQIQPKPKYTKRESQKSATSATEVQAIVRKYSDKRPAINGGSLEPSSQENKMAVTNPAYVDTETTDKPFVSNIAVREDKGEDASKRSSQVDSNGVVTADVNRSSERVQTPMSNHAPSMNITLYKASIRLEDDKI